MLALFLGAASFFAQWVALETLTGQPAAGRHDVQQEIMIDPRLLPRTICRLAKLDYDAVFTAGACCVFAIRLHERFGYPLRGVHCSQNPTSWSHVWVQQGSHGIDFRGRFREEILAALATDDFGSTIHDLTEDVVRAEIAKKEYPDEVVAALAELADRIFDSHERFVLARPANPEAVALFAHGMEGCQTAKPMPVKQGE